jgi:formate dehydrogenase (coenzyme F420) alpha subunit
VTERSIEKTLCRMCDDRCGIEVHLEDGRVIDIRPNNDHPWNRGKVCVKARAAIDMVYHPDRLLAPLKRTAAGWREIPLEQALDEIADRLKEIAGRHGARSVSVWKGEAVGFMQQEDMARRFIHAIGSPNYLSNDSECWVSGHMAYTFVDGGWPVPDFERADCVVVWGTNPVNSHPNVNQLITAARRRGAPLIVVDPRLSESARRADLHVAVRPGTDGALAWGLAREFIVGDVYDRALVEKHAVGFADVADYARQFTLDLVERETGVAAGDVRAMARMMAAAAPKVAVYVDSGLEHHENGVNNIRAVAMLDALLGSLDVEGGNRLCDDPPLRGLTLYDRLPLRDLGPLGADRFPVLYDVRRECHTMTALAAILDEDPYPLRAMIVTAANPVLTNPNTARMVSALEALDLLVVRDLFMSETAELADYVLPAASFLERSELHAHGKHQILNLTRRVVACPGVQTEYEFWHDLAWRLGAGEYFLWDDETALDRWLLEDSGITLEELAAHPEGVPYAPLHSRRWAEDGLNTPSGKIELTSRYLKGLGYDELPVYRSPGYLTDPDPDYPFVLMTGARKLLYLASRFRNIPRFRTAVPGPEVEMHPDDAAALQVVSGDTVRITSRIGTLDIPVRVVARNEIVPGALQITHGWREANVNLITHDDIFDPISGFPLMKSMTVRMEKVGSAPAGGDRRAEAASLRAGA